MKKILLRAGLALLLIIVAGYFYFLDIKLASEPELAGMLEERFLQHDEINRRYLVYVPESIAPEPSIIFVLHGSISSAETMRGGTAYRFEELAEEKGFLVVYPQGFDKHWNDCRDTADYQANIQNIDDVGFIKKIIDELQKEFSANTAAVYAMGASNGGHMAYRLALEAPRSFAAIAPVMASMPVDANLDCERSGRGLPIAIFNGTADPVSPYEGGVVKVGGNDSRGSVLSSRATAEYWASLLGHSEETLKKPIKQMIANINQQDDSTVDVQIWSEPGTAEVRLYTINGGGHTMPSLRVRMPRFLGPTNADIEAADEIVAFFEQY